MEEKKRGQKEAARPWKRERKGGDEGGQGQTDGEPPASLWFLCCESSPLFCLAESVERAREGGRGGFPGPPSLPLFTALGVNTNHSTSGPLWLFTTQALQTTPANIQGENGPFFWCCFGSPSKKKLSINLFFEGGRTVFLFLARVID
ncbi:hypothetical protein NQZ68_017352 [Dissostichus eleginoides]|nr:hypothetical protein NQZ68_017352 [Dissostichus eleginoides]